MGLIKQGDIDRVLEACNIVDVISEYMTLKKKGINFFGYCPFHPEKTASLSVSPTKQIWKCFSCHKAGNVFSFLMEHECIPYNEAVRLVAKKYKIEITEAALTQEEQTAFQKKESVYIALERALSLYRKNLISEKIYTDYMTGRNINLETQELYGVGASYSWNQLYNSMINAGFSKQILLDSGLLVNREKECFDYFRKRILFPFYDLQGKVIGFTGRVLVDDKKHAKYSNSPDTLCFRKGSAIFGLYQARQSISYIDKVYLVEGQFDVLSFVQAGARNTVCNSGTALTDKQIKLLLRFTRNVTLIYDGDKAGLKAAISHITPLVAAGASVRAVAMPDGQDPDEFAQKIEKDHLSTYLTNNEKGYVDYLYSVLDQSDEVEKENSLQEIIKVIAMERSESLRAMYVFKLSELSGMNKGIMDRKLRDAMGKNPLPEEKDIQAGVYGIEEAKELMDEQHEACEATSNFDRFTELIGSKPIVFFRGVPVESDVQVLRTVSTFFYLSDPDSIFSEKKECEELLFMKGLYRSGLTVTVENQEGNTNSFINHYIGIYATAVCEQITEDIKDVYLSRVSEMISFAPQTTRIRMMKEWAKLLSMPNEKALKDIVKPFLDQRKAKKNMDRERLDVEAELATIDPDRVPDYVEENETYQKMHRRYGFYPLHNKEGVPVSYMFKSDGGNSHSRVSDFFMEPLLHVYDKDKENNKRVLKLNRLYVNKPKYVEWKSSVFANMATFNEMLINEGAFNFENGDMKHFKKIWQWMSYEFQYCRELKVFGQQDENFFAFSNAIFHEVDGEYKIEKTTNLGIAEHNGEKYYSPAFSEIYAGDRKDNDKYAQDRWLVYTDVPESKRITFEHWAGLMDKVYRVNDNGKWATIYAIMSAFRSVIYPIDRLFTSIFFIGPTMSGKTQIAVSIRSLFIKPEAGSFNLNSGTDAAFFSILERFRDVPQIMEEYNDDMISDDKFQGLKSVTYDGDGKQKRKSATSNDVETSQVNASVILLGQEAPQKDDNALANRVVLCEVPKSEELNDPEPRRIFQELKDAEKAGLSYLLFEVLKLRSLFREKYQIIQRVCNRELQEAVGRSSNRSGDQTRVINTISLFLATCKLMEQHAPHLKLPFAYEEFFHLAVVKVNSQVEMISKTDKLATFFNTIDFMIDKGVLLPGRDFKIERPGKVTLKDGGEKVMMPVETRCLYINLSNVHKMYLQSMTGEKGLTLTTLEVNLKSHPSYIGQVKNTKFRWDTVKEVARGGVSTEEGSVAMNSDMKKIITKNEKQTSAMVLNYDILQKYMCIDFEREERSVDIKDLPF